MFLVRFVILTLFLETITSDEKISHHNRYKFGEQIQLQLSEQSKSLSLFFFAFLKLTSNSEYFEGKEESHSLSISEINDSERVCYLNV